MVKAAAEAMERSMKAAVQLDDNGPVGKAALLSAANPHGKAANACWCSTNVVANDRAHCKDTICVTLTTGGGGDPDHPPASSPPAESEDAAMAVDGERTAAHPVLAQKPQLLYFAAASSWAVGACSLRN